LKAIRPHCLKVVDSVEYVVNGSLMMLRPGSEQGRKDFVAADLDT